MAEARPSERLGMGAIPYERGTTFRVWALHADQVYVTGTFNDWSERAHPLAHEGGG
jgi:1,4-alpha-glucan branching enzyme